MTAIKLLETGELEERLTFLENAFNGQKGLPESVFYQESDEMQFSPEVDP